MQRVMPTIRKEQAVMIKAGCACCARLPVRPNRVVICARSNETPTAVKSEIMIEALMAFLNRKRMCWVWPAP